GRRPGGRGGAVPGGTEAGGRDELDESCASRASSASTRVRSAAFSARSTPSSRQTTASSAHASSSVRGAGGPVSTRASLARIPGYGQFTPAPDGGERLPLI